ncbi:glycosyltransferase [Thalassotalea mangrovi]|uniref:Glycosyltransferase n=1 Tax=Thalassotalea mangrovi TaxID=2572245 RepID=A0A4U1B6D7_9GAMM|nr:glycosyltransferase [Thalassotalea mangrovi]TKB46101.1 glycosyltransferase [Thalassotalea mangrovi]
MSLFRQAAMAFDSGDYGKALSLYELAGERFGRSIVQANMHLCRQRLNHPSTTDFQLPNVEQRMAESFASKFDGVFVVNLQRDVEKRYKIAHHLNRRGINFEFFNAIDGRKGRAHETFQAYQQRPLGKLQHFPAYSELEQKRSVGFIESAGAVGYLYTYIELLQQAKAKGLSRILILEDDVVLANDFHQASGQLISSIPEDWKVLHLGASQYDWSGVDLDEAKRLGYYQAECLATCGSFALALDVSIADELIELASGFEAPFDHLPLGHIYKKYPQQCVVAYPNIVIPDVRTSGIRGNRCQETQAQQMRWAMQKFDFPLPKPSINVFINDAQNLKYLPSFSEAASRPFELRIFRPSVDGPRPVHQFSGESLSGFSVMDEQALTAVNAPEADFSVQVTGSEPLSEFDVNAFIDAKFPTVSSKPLSNDCRLREMKPQYGSMVNGRVSVIITTYKRTSSLALALQSVIEQDYVDKEIIVVDDNGLGCETQRLVEDLVTQLKQQNPTTNIVYIPHSENRNGSAARNTGIFAASGEYLCFLDDDDCYLPGRLSKSVEVLAMTPAEIGAVYCGYRNGNENGNAEKRFLAGDLTEYILTLDYQKHYLHTNTATYKREAVYRLAGFDESYRRHQDLEFNLRFFQHFKMGCVTEALVQLRPQASVNENKVYNQELFDLKVRFLEQFRGIIGQFSQRVQNKIYRAHSEEIIAFSQSKKSLKAALKARCSNTFFQLYKHL